MPEPTPLPTPSPDLQRLQDLVQPVRELAVALVPEVPTRAGHVSETDTVRLTRPTRFVPLDLDANAVGTSLPEFDRVLAAVHDVAVTAFQHWIDRLAGRVAPTFAENEALARFVYTRSKQFGLGLYFDCEGTPRRVSLRAREFYATSGVSPAVRALGRYFAQSVNDESDPAGEAAYPNGIYLYQSSCFPPLIVARTAAEARLVASARRGDAAESTALT